MVKTRYKTRYIVAVLGALFAAEHAAAQRGGADEVRERRAARSSAYNPYWEGFVLKHEGNCLEAIAKLQPIAKQGFGYEDAQTALGECYLDKAGLSGQGGDAPTRKAVFDNRDFQFGLKWIGKAAGAGHFEAQALMVNLYVVGLGPDEDRLEAAKWAHLYLTNPQRLNLGAPVQIKDTLATLQASMDKESWLRGKERARVWVPVYSKPEIDKDAAPAPQPSGTKRP